MNLESCLILSQIHLGGSVDPSNSVLSTLPGSGSPGFQAKNVFSPTWRCHGNFLGLSVCKADAVTLSCDSSPFSVHR